MASPLLGESEERSGRGRLPIAHCPRPIAHRPLPTADGPSPIAHGRWPMAYRPWPMADGPWPMAHGPWPMAHGPWRAGRKRKTWRRETRWPAFPLENAPNRGRPREVVSNDGNANIGILCCMLRDRPGGAATGLRCHSHGQVRARPWAIIMLIIGALGQNLTVPHVRRRWRFSSPNPLRGGLWAWPYKPRVCHHW